MIRKARLVLKKRIAIIQEGVDTEDLKGAHYFEEDFYLGNSDKMTQIMK
jgi:hypothetical protein